MLSNLIKGGDQTYLESSYIGSITSGGNYINYVTSAPTQQKNVGAWSMLTKLSQGGARGGFFIEVAESYGTLLLRSNSTAMDDQLKIYSWFKLSFSENNKNRSIWKTLRSPRSTIVVLTLYRPRCREPCFQKNKASTHPGGPDVHPGWLL